MSTVAIDNRPWYREPWVWLVWGLPATVVVASVITLVLAVRSDDGVVADDYYKRGLAINEQLARTREAVRLGLTAAIDLDGIQSYAKLRLRLTGTQPLPGDAAVKLRLVNPGRSGADRVAMLARTPSADAYNAEYIGAWGEADPASARVAWRVVIEGRDWRIDGDAGPLAGPATLRIAAPQP
jgi:hypothetical protein